MEKMKFFLTIHNMHPNRTPAPTSPCGPFLFSISVSCLCNRQLSGLRELPGDKEPPRTGILTVLTTDSCLCRCFHWKAMWEALSVKSRHVFMSDIGRGGGGRDALNVQLTLKCACDIMPSTKRPSTKAPKLLWELQLEEKKKRKTPKV